MGFQIGIRKYRLHADAERVARADVTLTSMLALLGLMLAFTYAFSMSRADLRKQAFTAEVNAIGTAFLRADLAQEPGRTDLRERLLDYAKSRIVAPGTVKSRQELQEVVDRSLAAQAKIWPATKAVVQQKKGMSEPLKASLVQAVNDVLDIHTTKMAVIYDRLPLAVMTLLLLIAAVAIFLAAYNLGLRGHICRWQMGAFALILAALIFLILDFDLIQRGFIQIPQDSLVDLIETMEASLKE